jgi:hypothetical protein
VLPQFQQQSEQLLHHRHSDHHHQQQQQQQQQLAGVVSSPRPGGQSGAVLLQLSEGTVSDEKLPRLSECIRKFTPSSGAIEKPHRL